MAGKSSAVSSPSPEIFHLRAASPSDLEENFLALWTHWRPPERQSERCLVLVPSYGHAIAWKRTLWRRNIPAFNVDFLTPGRLRGELVRLLALPQPRLRGREESVFLLGRLAGIHGGREPLLQALARDASPLLRSLDELEAAGHPPSAFLESAWNSRPLKALVRDWEKLCGAHPGRDRARFDATLLHHARKFSRSLKGQLIALGFHRHHAAHLQILETALLLFQNTAVINLLPLPEDEGIQETWLSLVDSWLPGAEEKVPGQVPSQEEPTAPSPPLFFLAREKRREAEIIARQIRAWLKDADPGIRIGAIFPAQSPLPSLVAEKLQAAGILFSSDFRQPLPLRFEQSILADWITLQRDGLQADTLIRFWGKVQKVPDLFVSTLNTDPLSPKKLSDFLQDAFGGALTSDAGVLFHLRAGNAPPALVRFMGRWTREWQWPESASLVEFFAKFTGQLDSLVGPNIGQEIRHFVDAQLRELSGEWTSPVTRADAASLLEKFVSRPETTSGAKGWPAVHITSAENALDQCWDFLVLGGVNEGDWPETGRPASLLDDALREKLNRQVSSPAAHGGDELAFKSGFYPLLTDSNAYRLSASRFNYLRESARLGWMITASAWDELESHRALFPSEFYRRAWLDCHGDAFTPESVSALLDQDRELVLAPSADVAIANVSHAYHARRDLDQPFGPFQFMETPAPRNHPLSAGDAEKILKDPASSWFLQLLKLRPLEEVWNAEAFFPLFQGNLLHQALSGSVRDLAGNQTGFIPWPDPAEWKKALRLQIQARHQHFQEAFHSAGRSVPQWWTGEWARLHHAADVLLDHLHALRSSGGGTHLNAEFNFDLPLINSSAGSPSPLLFQGRADLVCLDAPTWNEASQVWILDFKTGKSAEDFSTRQLQEEAHYFQLAVYAAMVLARHPGPVTTRLAVVHRGGISEWSEVNPFADEFQHLWSILAGAWNEGRWGQVSPVRERFKTTGPMPLATLEVPENILAAKWAVTPGLNQWGRFHD